MYEYGERVYLIADPASGRAFSHWTGPVANPNSASTYVDMYGNKTVRAVFVAPSDNGGEEEPPALRRQVVTVYTRTSAPPAPPAPPAVVEVEVE